jgi:iron complex outermembrane receptor protein
VLVDGVRHRAQDWGLDHAPEIDPAIADRITVVRGASGVRFGPDAIGGAVLVDPPPMLLEPGFSTESHLVGLANGLGGSFMGRARAAPAAVPGLAFQFEGSAKRVRSASTPDYPLDNTAESEWSAGAAAAFRGENGTYQLSLRHFEADLGVCTCYRVESADDFFAQIERRRPLNVDLYRSDFEISRPSQAVAHDLAVARGRWGFAGANTLTATYALQYDHRREFDVVRQATMGPQFSFRLWTHDADVTVEHRPIHLSEHHHLGGSLGVTGMFQTQAYDGLPLVPDHRAIAGGVFLIERLWADGYEIEAGLRYDHLSRTASLLRRDFLRLVRSGQLTQETCGAPGSDTDPVTCASSFHTVSASLGGLLRFGSGWAAKLDLSTAARPPSPDEQYLNGTAPSFPVMGLGQPDAAAERSHSASATLTYAGERVSGEISGFGSYVADYLYFAPALGGDGQPIFDVTIRGSFPRFSTRNVDAAFYGADGFVMRYPGLGSRSRCKRRRCGRAT